MNKIRRWIDFLRDVVERSWDDYTEWRFKKDIAAPGCIHRGAILLKDPDCELTLGKGAFIEQGAILYCRNAAGSPASAKSYIRIGENSFIGHYCNLRTGGGFIDIGRDVLLGQFVSLIASGHGIRAGVLIRIQEPSARMGIRIGDGAWIGVNAVVLPGVTVGAGAVVGAAAVVTHDVPPNAIVAGNPARILRYRD